MSRPRSAPATMDVPAHLGRMTRGVTMTECAIHTVELEPGKHYACVVYSRPHSDVSAVAFLDREEVEEHIRLLRNAIEDAELANAGLPMKHAPTANGGR